MLNKYKIKRIINISICLASIVGGYIAMDRVLSSKFNNLNRNGLLAYYEQPSNTVDVLCLGNSHSGMNLDISLMWADYGISAFNLWRSAQTLDVTYGVLEEALKTQHPKVVVLEIFAATYKWTPISYIRNESWGSLVSNVDQFAWNENRVKTAYRAGDPGSKLNLFLGLPIFHQRYSSINKTDFGLFPLNQKLTEAKGSSYYYEVDSNFEWGDPNGVTEVAELDPDIEKYLFAIISLCRDKGIPLLFIRTPTMTRAHYQKFSNRIGEIASENGIPFINYDWLDDETGVIKTDRANGGHLNAHGSRKIGRHLAGYIATHYDLPDHRGDPRYASWDVFAKNTQTEWLQNEWELLEWFSLVKNSGESVLLVKSGNKEAQELLSMLSETLDISKEELENKDYAVWVSENPKEQPFTDRYAGGLSLETFINGEKFYFDFYDGLKFVYKDQGIEMIEDPDWLAVVYDQESGETMDVITINAETGEFAHLPAESKTNTL